MKLIIEKNDTDEIFSKSENVIGVVDGDSYSAISLAYTGETKIHKSPVDDIELYIFENRDTLLPKVSIPSYRESVTPKKASKTYWKYLVNDLKINKNELFEHIISNEKMSSDSFFETIRQFLTRD